MFDFSPDWNARSCYLVVLICAFFSAYVQIFGRLKALQNKVIYAWSLLRTWWVFSIYLCLPLLLFWLLDRTGALRDTSLFAALFVGLAYPAILSGGTSLKPSASVAGVFDWLNRAADSLASKTRDYVAAADRLFEQAIIRHIQGGASASAPAVPAVTPFDQVHQLALDLAQSPAKIAPELAAAASASDKAQIVYDYATNSVHGLKPITNLVKKWKLASAISLSPYDQARKWLLGYASIVAGLLVLVSAVVFGKSGENRFLIWRMVKPDVSAPDLNRTSVALLRAISTNDANALNVRHRVLAALHVPNLDLARADRILSLLLRERGKPDESRFAEVALLLTRNLRADSVDVRARIHHALLLLAEEASSVANGSNLTKELTEWTPLATQSKIDLERTVQLWGKWWDQVNATNAAAGKTQ